MLFPMNISIGTFCFKGKRGGGGGYAGRWEKVTLRKSAAGSNDEQLILIPLWNTLLYDTLFGVDLRQGNNVQ